MSKIQINNIIRDATAEEQAEIDARAKEWNDNSANRKLGLIKEIRLQKLQETDFYALSDVTLSTEMSAFRQKMRDLPQDYTTEDEYDLLLARDSDGKLTHTVWEKP